jgi:tetratricopeptide (TPR) repeat protein
MQSFNAVVRRYPDYLPAKISLAHLLATERHTEASDKILAGILELQPTPEPALTLLVGGDLQARRPGDAIQVLEHAGAAAPDYLDFAVRLGEIYVRTGDAQKALDLIGKRSGPGSRSCGCGPARGWRLARRRRRGPRCWRRPPTDLPARHLLAGLLLQACEIETARDLAKDGIAAMLRTYPLLQDYVMIALKDDGVEAALAAADLLQSQDRDYVPAPALGGDVYLAANRPDDALAAFAAALAAAPSQALLTRLIGAQLRPGRIEAAENLRMILGESGAGMVTPSSSSIGGESVPTAKNDGTSLVLVGIKVIVTCIEPLKAPCARL